jgi:hypothetical protein
MDIQDVLISASAEVSRVSSILRASRELLEMQAVFEGRSMTLDSQPRRRRQYGTRTVRQRVFVPRKKWTASDIAALREMYAAGENRGFMARVIGRPESQVSAKLSKLGLLRTA